MRRPAFWVGFLAAFLASRICTWYGWPKGVLIVLLIGAGLWLYYTRPA